MVQKMEDSMNRRDFIQKSALGFAGFALAGVSSEVSISKADKASKKQPNIVLLHTDQLRRDALSVYAKVWRSSGGIVETPNLDRLAAEGARFDNFYTPAPVCCPSRGSMLTGRYPHEHSVVVNEVIPLPQEEISLADALKSHGYTTAYFGKWHLAVREESGYVPPKLRQGFEYFFGHNRGHPKDPYTGYRGDDPTKLEISGYTTDVLTDELCGYIDKDHDQPFLAVCSWPDPHSPFWITPPYRDMYDWGEVPLPLNYQEDVDELPVWAKGIRNISERLINRVKDKTERKSARGYPGGAKTERQVFQLLTAQYWAMVKCIDDNVGRVLRCLGKKGILEDTIVAFTTDHGEFMGSHGMFYKGIMYDEAVRLPLIMRYPKTIPTGTIVPQMTSMIDLMPTLLEMTDASVPDAVSGRSFAELAAGRKVDDWPEEVFLSLYKSRAIRDQRYTYQLHSTAPANLFDHKKDPLEMRNAVNDPEHRDAVRRLHKKLVEWLKGHDDDVVKTAPVPEWMKA